MKLNYEQFKESFFNCQQNIPTMFKKTAHLN